MKHLIIGAGATLAEALSLGNAPEQCPPLIRDFARKTWFNYSPHPVLEVYLHELGYNDLGHDPRDLFYRLEDEGVTNIEKFMEFVWVNRNKNWEIGEKLPPGYISGFRITEAGRSAVGIGSDESGGFWENLLYHGIGSPISFYIGQCFFENGKGWKDLQLSKSIAVSIEPSDFILNLNYDTVFELALTQLGKSFTYAPDKPTTNQVIVCKPHGSLNMAINDKGFRFGQPGWLGMPQSPGFQSYSGIIPPRLNKNYSQHPCAKMILAPAHNRRPKRIIMWGVGFTDSDADLIDIYCTWGNYTQEIDIINPAPEVAMSARNFFSCNIRHFSSLTEYLEVFPNL